MTEPVRLEPGSSPGVLRIVLDRPEVRNAFDDRLVTELTSAFERASRDPAVRVIVLSGAGKAFCAGADLGWMSRMVRYGLEENRRDAEVLARLFHTIDSCPRPVVGRVQGAALGGGTGLVAVCDVAVAARETLFGTTEVRLGIVPSVIGPYVVRKIGESNARAWFLTGQRYLAEEALRAGLVHRVVERNELDAAIVEVTDALLAGGPEALAAAKELARSVGRIPLEEAVPLTVDLIAARRASAEGQEGMTAFLERREPSWIRRSE